MAAHDAERRRTLSRSAGTPRCGAKCKACAIAAAGQDPLPRRCSQVWTRKETIGRRSLRRYGLTLRNRCQGCPRFCEQDWRGRNTSATRDCSVSKIDARSRDSPGEPPDPQLRHDRQQSASSALPPSRDTCRRSVGAECTPRSAILRSRLSYLVSNIRDHVTIWQRT